MSEQFLATAFVKISPNVRSFRSELEAGIKAAIRGTEKSGALTAKVKVLPDLRGFKTALNTRLRALEGTFAAVKVPVTPVAGKAAAAGTAGGAGTGAAASGTAKLSDAQKRAKVTADLLTTAFRFNEQAANIMNVAMKRATFETSALAQSEVRLTGASAALQAVEKGLAAAIESGNQKAIARLASTRQLLLNTQQENAAVLQAAANEKILAGIRVKSAEAINLANTALTRTLTLQAKENAFSQASKALKVQLAAIERAIASAIDSKNVALAGALSAEQAELSLIQKKVAVEGELFAVMAREATATTALKAARAELTTVLRTEIGALTTLAEVKATESALNKAIRAEEKATTAAREAGITVINAESLALERLVAVRQAELVTQRNIIKGAAVQATAQAAAARGAGATFLSLLKVRGATLAAGSEFLAGAAAVAIFAKAIQSASQLEQELNVFAATASATGDEMERVRQKALDLGADITLPAVSADDAAQAFTSLAKAGLDVENSIDGARGVLQLATAANIENAEATELVASALNSFGLAGIQATRVADLLTGAANEAQGSITDMGIALQQSSAVARQAGLSLEDTVTFITLLAQNGIRGSDAGTSLRTALLRLIAPTQDASKELKRLGITIFDAQDQFRPEVFAELATELENMNAKARNQTLRKIFGQDAIRAAVIFGREGAAGLNETRDAITEVGLAQELANARTRGFAGSVEALKNSLATLGTTLGSVLLPPLQLVVEIVNQAFSDFNRLAGVITGVAAKARSAAADLGSIKVGPVELDAEDAEGKASETIKKIHSIFLRSRVIPLPIVLGQEGIDTVRERLGFVQTQAEKTRQEIREVFEELKGAGATPTALNEAALALQNIIRKLEQGGPEARRLAADVQILLENIQSTDFALPPLKMPEIEIPPSLRTGTFGREIIDPSINVMEAAFPELFAVGKNMTEQIAKGAEEGIPRIVDVFKSIIPKITTRILDLQEEFNKQVVSGNRNAQIANLRQQQAEQQKIIDAANRGIAQGDFSGPGGPTELKKLKDARRAAQAELASLTTQIEGIEGSITSDLKSASDEIAKTKDEQDKALLKAFGRETAGVENKLIVAEATESLKDDIKFNIRLRAILRRQVEEDAKKIKDLETRRTFIAETTRKIIQLTQEIKADQKEQRRAEREAVREQADRAIRGVELDIEFAEITENTRREVALRRKLIKQLEDRIKLEKGNTNKIKELRNEIARQKEAIKEALQESEDRKDAFKALLFSFLQTQQGFAANLLGNLIPTNVTGLSSNAAAAGSESSLAGRAGAAPLFQPPREIAEASALSGARIGVSSGQANTTNDILNRILAQLVILTGTNRHPEAKHQRAVGTAAHDYGI